MLQVRLYFPKHPIGHNQEWLAYAREMQMQMHSHVCADSTTEGKTHVIFHQ